MRRLLRACACGLVIAALSASARADLIAQHVGAADPQTEGFSLDTNGGACGTVSNDLGSGTDAWNLSGSWDGATGWVRQNYFVNLSAGQLSKMNEEGWQAQMVVRNKMAPSALSGGIAMRVSTSATAWDICVGSDSVGNPTLSYTDSARVLTSVSLGQLGSAYHTYALSGAPGAIAATLWVDGVSYGQFDGYVPYAGDGDVFRFGCNDSRASYDANYSLVSFNTVPEPATLTLLATGLLGLIAYAWRKRR